jgi:hypothetical protein
MVAEGQWAVGTAADYGGGVGEECDGEGVVNDRAADGRRVELTVEVLARAVGARLPEAHREESAE